MRKLLISAVIVTFALAPAAAQATQRFVSPSGSGSACTAAAPCSITTGTGSASANDEVIVGAGTYTETSSILTGATGLVIHGAPGSRPVINTTATYGINLTKTGVTVRDLTVNSNSAFYGVYVTAGSATLERLEVHQAHASATGCVVAAAPTTVTDSFCEAGGASSYGMWVSDANGTIRLRNDDLIGDTATNVGLYASEFTSGNNQTVDARNVIVDGGSTDVRAFAPTGTSSTVTFASSNYDSQQTSGPGTVSVTPHGTAGNQTDLPIFVNGFHQADGSPTIDAGTTDAFTSGTDLDGQARPQGPAMDIGADEVPVATPPGDTTPPHTTLQTGPKQKSKSKTAEFTFVSDEAGSTFTCQVDAGAAGPCTSPLKVAHLKKGKHTFSVFATDAAGNADSSPSTYSWTVKAKKRKKHHHHH